jgi:hypothetical protein
VAVVQQGMVQVVAVRVASEQQQGLLQLRVLPLQLQLVLVVQGLVLIMVLTEQMEGTLYLVLLHLLVAVKVVFPQVLLAVLEVAAEDNHLIQAEQELQDKVMLGVIMVVVLAMVAVAVVELVQLGKTFMELQVAWVVQVQPVQLAVHQ